MYSIAGEGKNYVSDHFIDYEVVPNSNYEAEIAVADSLFGTTVRRVTVRQGGVVEVDLHESAEALPVFMIFWPTVISSSDYPFWQCSRGAIDRQVLRKLRPSCDVEADTPS